MVEPNDKPTLIYTIWTEKSCNPDNFRAQMKSIWKTKKKFEIQLVGQKHFFIVFESEKDLETIMEGVISGGILRFEINGSIKKNQETHPQNEKSNGMIQEVQDDSRLTLTEKVIKIQKEREIIEKETRRNKTNEDMLKPTRKSSCKRIESAKVMKYYGAESKLKKRKSAEIEDDDYGIDEIQEDAAKRMRYGG
ncbi:hypothetical protein PVK06_031559 [Gossypium arboreum]|uniref:DUF4283 domain-containing protein n=1 Tax=Gossypium arboreum TaxID=29729 RepID=A0ABR0NRL6_GOSAR|nr:hypothetical protein PVK06_031559 [Gossypium arboreum]